ncbi:MAG: HAD-IB family hydrolase, partial [Proteobacteria bacterium]|nr:HAD-IB family hydrolase [Pseudomonadota bacterium]
MKPSTDRLPNLALFDFDGTITTNDNFTPFIYFAVEPKRLAVGKVVLSPLLVRYKLGLLPASKLRVCLAQIGFRGRIATDIQNLGLNYSRQELSKFIRPQALEKIQWHKAQGDVVAVVSASLDVYLSDWCKQLGLDLICTELEFKDGALTGRYRRGDCTGEEKLRRIREKYDIQKFPVVYAYSDTEEDREMMSIANRKYFR